MTYSNKTYKSNSVIVFMNIQFYIEKLNSSDEFAEFRRENPDAYLCSCFIVVDKEGDDSKVHLDYYAPKDKKIMSFHTESMKKIPLDAADERIPEKIPGDVDVDFNEVENLISEKMREEDVTSKLQKIILSMQNKNGTNFLIGTVFISMLGMIKLSIDLSEMKIIDFEKKSFFDIMKIVKNDK